MMRYILMVCLVVGFFAGCQSTEPVDPNMDKLGRATGPVEPGAKPHGMAEGMPLGMGGKGMPPGMMGKAPPPGMGKTHKGQVLEVISASRYTYVQIKPGFGDVFWAAVPQTELKKGQSIEVIESLVMRDFESPTLKRTFPLIVFGVLAGQQGAAGMPGKMGGGGMPPSGGKMPPGKMPPGKMPPEGGKMPPEGGKMPPGHPPTGEPQQPKAPGSDAPPSTTNVP